MIDGNRTLSLTVVDDNDGAIKSTRLVLLEYPNGEFQYGFFKWNHK